MSWIGVVNALLGVWFVLAPFLFRFTDHPQAMWLSVIGGAVLFALAGWGVATEEYRLPRWVAYLTGLLGVGFILFPYLLKLRPLHGETLSSVVAGAIVLILSAWRVFGSAPREAPA